MAASFFWDRVAQHHSYATGGHGLAEYFGAPDQLSARVDGRTCESCNVYNMLKLTRRLFSFRPDAFYADFHERALFNHILASIDPDDGAHVVHGAGRPRRAAGISEHAAELHLLRGHRHGEPRAARRRRLLRVGRHGVGESVRAVDGGAARWATRIAMETSFPDGDTAKLTLTRAASRKTFTLAIRRPVWAGDGFAVKVNGDSRSTQPTLASLRAGGAGGRNVARGRSRRAAAEHVRGARAHVEDGRHGRAHAARRRCVSSRRRTTSRSPRSCGDRSCSRAISARVAKAARSSRDRRRRRCRCSWRGERPHRRMGRAGGSRAGNFRASQVARVPGQTRLPPGDVALTPFYRTHRRTYSVYFDVLTPARVRRARRGDLRRARASAPRRGGDDLVHPAGRDAAGAGVQLSERARRPARRRERTAARSRGGAGWFSFDLPVDPQADMAVLVTYFNELGLPPATGNFEIQVDGTRIAQFAPNASATGFYDAQYAIPADLTRGKARVTVKFAGVGNGRIAPVFGVRMIKAGGLAETAGTGNTNGRKDESNRGIQRPYRNEPLR